MIFYKVLVPNNDYILHEVTQDVIDLHLSPTPTQQPDKILNSRVYKQTWKKNYLEHLVKWLNKDDVEATWAQETNFKRLGIDSLLPNPRMD